MCSDSKFNGTVGRGPQENNLEYGSFPDATVLKSVVVDAATYANVKKPVSGPSP